VRIPSLPKPTPIPMVHSDTASTVHTFCPRLSHRYAALGGQGARIARELCHHRSFSATQQAAECGLSTLLATATDMLLDVVAKLGNVDNVEPLTLARCVRLCRVSQRLSAELHRCAVRLKLNQLDDPLATIECVATADARHLHRTECLTEWPNAAARR
jgi:hypothetical protein